ncbi:hypothetical protein, partial [Noviherbaspirillum massiliense]|uniref:hypothetical protein n=1 Tax=Noviherbaspirillum massiliense TaxID=1465823 RepID=UPI001C54DF22
MRLAAALPSSAHTYRLLIFKEPLPAAPALGAGTTPTNRFVCQQQRNEIMKLFSFRVKHFFTCTCYANCFFLLNFFKSCNAASQSHNRSSKEMRLCSTALLPSSA